MDKDQAISQQAEQLWGSYFAERQTARWGSEEFWEAYGQLRNTTRQNRQAVHVQKAQNTPLIWGAELMTSPKKRITYWFLLLKSIGNTIFVAGMVATAVAVVSVILLDILGSKDFVLVLGAAGAWCLTVLVVCVLSVKFYIDFYKSLRLRLKVEQGCLITRGKGLKSRKVPLGTVTSVETEIVGITVSYHTKSGNKKSVAIPAVITHFEELKHLLEKETGQYDQ